VAAKLPGGGGPDGLVMAEEFVKGEGGVYLLINLTIYIFNLVQRSRLR
jgi:hypothetical protein